MIQEMSLAIKPYLLELCGLWHRLIETPHSPITDKKVGYYMTITLRISGDSRSIVVFEKVSSNHIFGPKTVPKSYFFWM